MELQGLALQRGEPPYFLIFLLLLNFFVSIDTSEPCFTSGGEQMPRRGGKWSFNSSRQCARVCQGELFLLHTLFALADSFFEIQCMVDKIRERAQLSVWNYQAAKTEDSFSSG